MENRACEHLLRRIELLHTMQCVTRGGDWTLYAESDIDELWKLVLLVVRLASRPLSVLLWVRASARLHAAGTSPGTLPEADAGVPGADAADTAPLAAADYDALLRAEFVKMQKMFRDAAVRIY